MTKADLISKVAETTENTKTDCDAILSTAFNVIAEELKTGGSFAWPQFGKFEVVIRAARKGVNPATETAHRDPADHGSQVQGSPGAQDRSQGIAKR